MLRNEKYDDAVALAKKYLADPLHRYFKEELETKLNDYGYSLMSQQKFQEANNVLRINVEVFPESANAYDSYAESWLLLGNKEEAMKYYKIAVNKDPDGITGANARKALEGIK